MKTKIALAIGIVSLLLSVVYWYDGRTAYRESAAVQAQTFTLLETAAEQARGAYILNTNTVALARDWRGIARMIFAAAQADGFAGGAQIRHAMIGGITKIEVFSGSPYLEHVEVTGTEGSRHYWGQ